MQIEITNPLLSFGRLIGTVFVCALLPAVSGAQGLMQDFEKARNFDPTFAAARIENKAGELEVKITRMAFYPNARVSVSQLDNENSSRTTLSVTQPILSYEKWLTLKEADPKLALAGAKLEQSQYDLAQRLFKAVSALVDSKEKIALNIKSLNALETQALSARRAFELGMGTITDLRDTEVRLAQVRSQSFVLQAASAAAERQYVALVGHASSGAAYTLKTKLNAFNLPPLDDFMQRAEQRSPALRSNAVSITLAEISKQKNRAALMPSVNAFVQRSQIGGLPAVSNSGVALRMDVPIQAGSFFKGAAADLELNKAQENERNTRQQIRLDVERFYNQLEAIQSELLVRAESIKASELSLDANEQSFKGGVRTKLDVLNALQALFQARADYASAQLRLGETYLSLLTVSATDADEALTQINDMLFTE
jgi:protease secretion system outer membrane protein